MNKSYAFIGTSHLYACEYGYTWPQQNPPKNLRFEYQTNLIQSVSKRNANSTIYNCSEMGHGITTYFKRILTLMDRYNPDVFVFEIPNGPRMLAHTSNEYGENYDIHFPVQVWEAGHPQNLDEEFRKVSASIIDDRQMLMSSQRLNKYWTTHTNMVFNLGDKQWQGYTGILSNFQEGMKSRFSDTIAQCEIINEYLVSKGKEVYWFSWVIDGPQKEYIDSDKMTLLNYSCDIMEWKYEKDVRVRSLPLQTPREEKIKRVRQHYKHFCYDGSHLSSKYMPEFAEYFDEIFK
tara:strand:- start:79 stop:948 length:870 start_codon:yes stop_codon:yes gene_type:complete